VSEQFQPFTEELKRQGKNESTITHYLSDLALYARWVEQTYGEPFRIEEMTLSDVRAYLAYLRTVQKLKPASINRKLAALKALSRWAVATGLLAQDPTRDVKGVRQQRHGPRALSAQEFRRMVRKAEQTGRLRDVAILETLGRTGLRVSELTALELDDVELKERSGLLTVRSGKGARFRQVPLPCEVRRAMREYLENTIGGVAGCEKVRQPGRGRVLTTHTASYVRNAVFAEEPRRPGGAGQAVGTREY